MRRACRYANRNFRQAHGLNGERPHLFPLCDLSDIRQAHGLCFRELALVFAPRAREPALYLAGSAREVDLMIQRAVTTTRTGALAPTRQFRD